MAAGCQGGGEVLRLRLSSGIRSADRADATELLTVNCHGALRVALIGVLGKGQADVAWGSGCVAEGNRAVSVKRGTCGGDRNVVVGQAVDVKVAIGLWRPAIQVVDEGDADLVRAGAPVSGQRHVL